MKKKLVERKYSKGQKLGSRSQITWRRQNYLQMLILDGETIVWKYGWHGMNCRRTGHLWLSDLSCCKDS